MSPALHRLLAFVPKDKKKLSMALLLVAVGLLLWGRLLLKEVPRTATADPAAKARAGNQEARPAPTLRRPVVELRLAAGPPRDPFALDRSLFEVRPQPVANPGTEAKLPPVAVDVSPQEAARKAGLVLQSTFLGDQPRAVINGQVLAPGQQIQGFLLKQVTHGKVLMEWSGVEFELAMQNRF